MDTIEPSAQTPPVFDVVAPLSVPMNTSLFELISGWSNNNNPRDNCKTAGRGARRFPPGAPSSRHPARRVAKSPPAPRNPIHP